MNTDEGWRHKLKTFGPESLNELDRWRMGATQRAEARAHAKDEMRRTQERQERQIARAGAVEQIATLRAELATLCAELATLQAEFADAMNTIASTFGTLADERHERREEIRQLKAEVTKVGATMDQLSVGRFNREREVVDLPNPLIRRTTVN
jgi:chromosome segregation ATPase